MANTVDVSVGTDWTILINAASTVGTASWEKPHELYIAKVAADGDTPTVKGHRLDYTQQISRMHSGFDSGCIKARSATGSPVSVAVTQG